MDMNSCFIWNNLNSVEVWTALFFISKDSV